jgi:putative tryptophan/tyrosine transport system substrate-binding protein
VKRREFIALAGCAAVAWPRAAGAQQTKLPTIGVLSVANPAAWALSLSAFVAQLGELGWIDGRTVAIEYRWADGRSERFAELAAELVRLKVDVIVTAGAAVAAAKQATTIIPIVFAVASDPLATGLIATLAHPGSNVTGLSVQAADVAGKRVELLRELFPGGRTLAIMANLGYAAAEREMSEVQAAARSVGFETTILEIRSAQDIAGSIDKLKPGADLLYVCIDPITDTNQILIATSNSHSLCCDALGRDWHVASIRCGAKVQTLSEVKRTCRDRRRRINPTRLTQTGHRRPEFAVMHNTVPMNGGRV